MIQFSQLKFGKKLNFDIMPLIQKLFMLVKLLSSRSHSLRSNSKLIDQRVREKNRNHPVFETTSVGKKDFQTESFMFL